MRISKNTFIKLVSFREHECFAMSKYLEEKASQGWMLKDMFGSFLIFKKIEPKKCYFTVDIFSNLNQREYIEYCEAAGWKYICGCSKYNVFYTEDKETIPIQTDEEIVLKKVHKSVLKNLISSCLIIPLMILNLYTMQNSAYSFVRNISSNTYLLLALELIIVIACSLITNISDAIWLFKSRKSLKLGYDMNYPTLDNLKIKIIADDFYTWVLGLMLINVINGFAFNKFHLYLALCVGLFAYYLGKIVSIILNKNNKIIHLSICIIGTLLATHIVLTGNDITNYESNNNKAILKIDDIIDIKVNSSNLYIENYNSLISNYYSYSYNDENASINEVDAIDTDIYEDNSIYFNYEILKSKYNKALDAVWKSYLDTYTEYEYYKGDNRWNALKVYKANYSKNNYLLRYEDRIVLVSLSSDFTQEDIELIKDRCINW